MRTRGFVFKRSLLLLDAVVKRIVTREITWADIACDHLRTVGGLGLF